MSVFSYPCVKTITMTSSMARAVTGACCRGVLAIVFSAFAFIAAHDCCAQTGQGRIIMDIPHYPMVFELNVGETQPVTRSYKGKITQRDIKLVSVRHFTEPNLWFTGKFDPENYSGGEVVLEVSGKRIALVHRPYEMPTVFDGLRLFVETTKDWARNAELADMKDVQKDVRLSVCMAGEPWGPPDVRFPINDYRWRSAAYNNTWSSLVPYNKLYYHRGEDYGAIPDRLTVVSPVNGTIVSTPLPNGDGASNGVRIKNKDGIIFRIAHMNIESINKDNVEGTEVKAGTMLGKTGMTWDGRKSQVNDPHCHIELGYGNTKIASFPYLMEAYLRKYKDPVLAIAGGYQFTTVNRAVTLDGSRSIARDGESIVSYVWKLHDGNVIDSASTTVSYEEPGLYSEELVVKTGDGQEDRDFVQVRVYGENARDLAYGWAYYAPVRNIKPGKEVLFWNRLANTASPATIDFGDGSDKKIIDRELTHSYRRRGIYTVALSGTDKQGHIAQVKLEVRVE
jgi:murein DD-endopeptidase MepM/ murein hydrolase activator NlpD